MMFFLLKFLMCSAFSLVVSAANYSTEITGLHFIKYNGLSLSTYYDTFNSMSDVKCCALCARNTSCHSVTHFKEEEVCRLSTIGRKCVLTDATNDLGADVWSRQPAPSWGHLVFRGTKGNGVDPYFAFMNGGTGTTSTNPDCMVLEANACTLHYRSPDVNNWGTLGVTQVRFSYYKDCVEVAYVLFNGIGSTSTSWFSIGNVIESSWPDMLEISPEPVLSPQGMSRRFVMHVAASANCSHLLSYGMAVTSAFFGCDYDMYPTYPQYMYSVLDTAGTGPNYAADYGLADMIAIHIRVA